MHIAQSVQQRCNDPVRREREQGRPWGVTPRRTNLAHRAEFLCPLIETRRPPFHVDPPQVEAADLLDLREVRETTSGPTPGLSINRWALLRSRTTTVHLGYLQPRNGRPTRRGGRATS